MRLTALDAFRGATLAFMVLVNNPGDGATTYWPLKHAAWHGWTPTDVVFPSFVWIVGVALVFSLAKRQAKGAARGELILQAARRAAIIFALGLLVYLFPKFDFSTMRILGVLQRIALAYFCAVVITLFTGLRGRWAAIAALLGGYWLLMKFYPVPGYGAGHLDVERNFAHYIDRIVLGVHNYANTKTWDPEGIVSTLPAIATALLGTVAGEHVRAARYAKVAAQGAVLLALGLLCDQWLPINKPIWTSSFALFMAGLDGLLLAAAIWLIDLKGQRRLVEPFVTFGLNPITLYMASELLDISLSASGLRRPLYQAAFLPLAPDPYVASLLYALANVAVIYALAWFMRRRGWVVSV